MAKRDQSLEIVQQMTATAEAVWKTASEAADRQEDIVDREIEKYVFLVGLESDTCVEYRAYARLEQELLRAKV